jgi:hypothetical protein
MVIPFVRKHAFMALLGVGNTKFHEEQNAGRISPPDTWLGPRTPVWLETTVKADMARMLDAPKPIETRPLRRRRTQ